MGPVKELLSLSLDEVQRILRRHAVHRTSLVVKRDAVALVGNEDNLGTEGGADELCLLRLGDGVEQRRDGCSVLSVKVSVDLVKDDERRRLGGLKGEDEADGAESCLAR